MVALDVEHPPAAGTALAVVISQVTLANGVVIITSVLLITQCRYMMRKFLKNLL